MPADYDIAVIGGHLVGALFVCALAESGYRVAMIDQHDYSKKRQLGDEYDLRVFALSQASQNILDGLGLWSRIRELRARPYYSMYVWDQGGDGVLDFDCSEIASPVLGHIVEEQVLMLAAYEKLRNMNNVKMIFNRSLTDLVRMSNRVELALDDDTRLSASLLVGADGFQSRVRQLAGLETLQGSYDQQAIVATIATEKSLQDTAWQRFLSTGPLAFLPLADRLCSIVWSLDIREAELLLELGDHEFESRLAEAFAHKLGALTLKSARRSFPLRYLHAKKYTLPRVALIGDAAHTVHPLAGQGVNLGLLDAAVLAEELGKRNEHGDAGEFGALRRYERRRKGDNLLMLGAMGGFKKLFGASGAPVPLLRNLGMKLVNQWPWAKHRAMRQAAGLSGDLPALARPVNFR